MLPHGALFPLLQRRRLAARGPGARRLPTALRADADRVALPLVRALAQRARYTSLLDLPGHAADSEPSAL